MKFNKKYYFNQPIDYYSNSILYYNKYINLIFEIFLEEDNKNFCFNFKEEKLNQILNLKGFINSILLIQLKDKEFTKELDLSIKFFIFICGSKIKTLYNKFEENFIIKKNDYLNKEYAINFFFKEKFHKKIKICYDRIIIEDESQNITFDFNK